MLFGKVDFYEVQTVSDYSGGTQGVYGIVLSTRAGVQPMTGKRTTENGQREDVKTTQFTIRWRKDIAITTDLILMYQGIPYSIYSVVDEGNKRTSFVILARAKEGMVNLG